MSPLQKQVIEFHQQFDHPILPTPQVPPPARTRVRMRLLFEELCEAFEAVGMAVPNSVRGTMTTVIDESLIRVDLVKLADALGDLDYVSEGTRLECGIEGGGVADEIHRTNMNKRVVCAACGGCGDDHQGGKCPTCRGKGRILLRRADGKTLKPSGWTPPEIDRVLQMQTDHPALFGLQGIVAQSLTPGVALTLQDDADSEGPP